MNTADYLLAKGHPDDAAVLEVNARYTYRDLATAVEKVSAHLQALDLPPGSRVGVLGPNSLLWVAGYLAALKCQFVAVPFSTMLTPTEVERNAALAQCSVAVMDRRTARRLSDCFPGEGRVLTEEILSQESLPFHATGETDPDSDATLMFTSGTTALPRGVRLTHANIQANTDSIVTYLGLDRSDRMLVILPFSYVFGASLLHTHLRVGGSLALCNTFTFPETSLDMLERLECTGLAGVPSSYQMLLRLSTFRSRPLPSLRTIQQAGGKLSPVLIQELVAAQPSARVFVMYGAAEATARMSYLPPEDLPTKLGSIGRGIPGVELQVRDQSGLPVSPGQTGEIHARGANISPGYLDDPEGTAEKFIDGWFRTGDLGTVDDDGYLYVLDRKDDFIKSWGHRVSSQEIEAAALSHPALVSAAAVGVPDPMANEAIWLFVTVNPSSGVTPEDIASHCRKSLARYQQPTQVRILESLPLNSSGKVVKARLRELAGRSSEEASH